MNIEFRAELSLATVKSIQTSKSHFKFCTVSDILQIFCIIFPDIRQSALQIFDREFCFSSTNLEMPPAMFKRKIMLVCFGKRQGLWSKLLTLYRIDIYTLVAILCKTCLFLFRRRYFR